jgi:hypothetical protein
MRFLLMLAGMGLVSAAVGQSAFAAAADARYRCDTRVTTTLHVAGEATEIHDGTGDVLLLADVADRNVSVKKSRCTKIGWTDPVRAGTGAKWRKPAVAEMVVSCSFPAPTQVWVKPTATGYVISLGFGGKVYAVSRHGKPSSSMAWHRDFCTRGAGSTS